VVRDTQYYEELDTVIARLSKTLPFTFRIIAMTAKICKTNLQIYEWYYMCIYINMQIEYNHIQTYTLKVEYLLLKQYRTFMDKMKLYIWYI